MNDRDFIISLQSQIAVQLGTTPPVIPPVVPPVVPPGTCPPFSGSVGDLGPQGTLTHPQFQSGQVICYALPTNPSAGQISAKIKIGETTSTAPQSFLEICISKCPGLIDKTAGANYQGTNVQNYSEMLYFLSLGQYTLATLNAFGWAYAPTAEGRWYLNVRVTYPTPPAWGYDGRVITWGNGGY